MAALATAGLTACSSDEDTAQQQSNYPTDGVVRFNVGVSDMQTRASIDDISKLTEFGVTVYNANTPNGTETPTYTYLNKKVTGNNTDGWKPSTQMLWQNSTQAVTMAAYAPYNADLSLTESIDYLTSFPITVSANQSSSTYESDFLVWNNDGKAFTPKDNLTTDGKVNITFKHALSQLVFDVKFGSELNETYGTGTDGSKVLTTDPISSFKVSGTVREGEYYFPQSTCDLKSKASPEDIAAYQNSFTPATSATGNATAEYRCIVIPQDATDALGITLKIGDEDYKWTADGTVNLVAGTSYTIPITVGNNKVLVTGSITANEWKDGTTTADIETK